MALIARRKPREIGQGRGCLIVRSFCEKRTDQNQRIRACVMGLIKCAMNTLTTSSKIKSRPGAMMDA